MKSSRSDTRTDLALLRLGGRLGYLTYEMLNEGIPDEVVRRPGRLDALLFEIDRRGIRLIDEAEAP